MSDFAPVDGRSVWATGPGIVGGKGRARGPVEVSSPAKAPDAHQTTNANQRLIVDEVELSAEALNAGRTERPTREEVVALARDRIARGYYEQAGVIDRTIDRVARDLVG